MFFLFQTSEKNDNLVFKTNGLRGMYDSSPVKSIMIFKILLILLAFGGTRVPAFDIFGSDPYSY
jgi:hypothetical protein